MIIVPPPTKKLVVDRTAAFVAQKGRHVEEEILNRPQAQNASSFTFLLEEDPFHAYYLSKIEEFQNGKPPAPPPPPAAAAASEAKAPELLPAQQQPEENSAPVLSNSLTIAMKSVAGKQQEVIAPPAFEFTLEPPPGVSSVELQLIQLTAQFAATDGKKFESDLHHNIKKGEQVDAEEFYFVFPQSGAAYKYYADLVRCYKIIIQQGENPESNTALKWCLELANDPQVLLNRAVLSFEQRRQAEQAKRDAETDETRALDRQQFLEIDWHDFVIVETISFDNDQQQQNSVARFVSMAADAARKAAMEEEEEDDEGMVIRQDYQVEPVRMTKSTPMVTLPDGKRVPVDQMNAHIRTELLDPKWRENQDKFDKRQRDTNLVEASSMFTNLAKMAEARPDVFGGEAEEAGAREEEKRRREAGRIVWDGNMLTADSVKAAVAAAKTTPAQQFIPQAPAGSLPPPPLPPAMPSFSSPPPPPAVTVEDAPPEEKRMRMTTTTERGDLYRITIPSGAGAPASSQPFPDVLEFPVPTNAEYKSTTTVQQFKDQLSKLLFNIPVGKFQLKSVADGKFLKNTDLLSNVDGQELEIKWKSR